MYEDIREMTKQLLRKQTPSIDNYEEALPLCKKLWENYSQTHDLWDVHQYANCLKKLGRIDEAEQVCDDIYNENKGQSLRGDQIRSFEYIKNLYAWIINDKYIKPIKNPKYKYCHIVLDKLILLHELLDSIENNEHCPNYSYCVLSVIRVLNKLNEDFNNAKSLFVLNLLDVNLLSQTSRHYKHNTGKECEIASDKELFFQLKSELLLREKQYEDCILCCTEAINEIEKFHYGNDVWFERRLATALNQIGKIEDAINTLKKLINISDKWFLLYELGKMYLKIKDVSNALICMLRAVCTKDPEKMKVNLIESIGDILTYMGNLEFAQENYNFVKQVRKDNNWGISNKLNNKINKVEEVKLMEIRKHWLSLLHNIAGSKYGRIINILPNRRGGFIQSDQQYYFQYKNFFGKNDLSKIGDNVKFIVVGSYDKKKVRATEEAVAIIPLKK